MRYKLLALDLDGTLLNSQSEVPAKHIEAVRKAQDDGIIVVIATGRYYVQTERIIQALDFDGIVVSIDGAAIIKNKTKEIIHEHSFTVEEISPLITYCRQNEIHFYLTTAFNHYVEFISPYQIDKCKKYEIHIKLRASAEFFKEYVHLQTSKTNGLRKVLESYGIAPSEIIAIGEFYNDLDMIEYAGLGIAMGNAPDDIKEKANDVTLSNDQDGVFYALEKHLNW